MQIAVASREQLDAGLGAVREAPGEVGTGRGRPTPGRGPPRALDEARLDPRRGLVGDRWSSKPSSSSDDGGPDADAQVTMMSARAAALVAASAGPGRWAPAGDQLYVDLDLSEQNLPPGARIAVGEAMLEVSALPHTGCGKFARRFGVEALKFVNSKTGRALRLARPQRARGRAGRDPSRRRRAPAGRLSPGAAQRSAGGSSAISTKASIGSRLPFTASSPRPRTEAPGRRRIVAAETATSPTGVSPWSREAALTASPITV